MSMTLQQSCASDVPSPTGRAYLFWRLGIATLMLLVFWLDLRTPAGVSVPMFYVVPTLLFMWGGRPWEPVVVAAIATILTGLGGVLTPAAEESAVGLVNRSLEVVGFWIAAGVVAVHRVFVERCARRAVDDHAALEASVRRLEEIRYALDQAAIVAITDQRGIITYANDKFCEISKYSREELIGQDHRIINSGYHSKEFIRDLWRTIASGRVWRGEVRNRARDGSLYWVDTTIVPFVDASGKPRQYLAIRSDITQRKAAEAQLREQAALTHLGQLAAVVAHEVRNPLAGVRGTLQVLASRLPDHMRERAVITTMVDRIDELNDKVTDLLVYARPTEPRLQPVPVGPLIADAAASARATMGNAAAGFHISGEPALVRADPDMLRPVLLNLLLNAYQAGGDHPIEIDVCRQNGTCTVAVLDRGPGIPPDVRERIFEPFYTTKRGGTGLGLPVVKRLVEMQGGTVALRERTGGGTAAEVTLPAA